MQYKHDMPKKLLSPAWLRRDAHGTAVSKQVRAGNINQLIAKLTSCDTADFERGKLLTDDSPGLPLKGFAVALAFAFVLALICWLCSLNIDTYASARGRVQPLSQSNLVQPNDIGVIKHVYVKNGDFVKKGDILFVLDKTDVKAKNDAVEADVAAASAEIARRRLAIKSATSEDCCTVNDRELSNGTPIEARENALLKAEIMQLDLKLKEIKQQIVVKQKTSDKLQALQIDRSHLIDSLKTRLGMKTQLVGMGAGSKLDVIDAQQRLEAEQINVATDKGQLLENSVSVTDLQRELDLERRKYVAAQSQMLEKASRDKDRLEQSLVRARAKLSETNITAASDGFAQQLTVNTIGQVVRGGEALLKIVPLDAPTQVDALFSSKDVGELSIGQEAVVKVDAFPFMKYGVINARLSNLSRDAVDARTVLPGPTPSDISERNNDFMYPAEITLGANTLAVDSEKRQLTSGMAVSVEVSTRKRRLFEVLLSPLRDLFAQAGHER